MQNSNNTGGVSEKTNDGSKPPNLAANNANHEEHKRHGVISSTVFNTLCCSMGGGILALPMAMYKGSIVISTILVIICGLLSACSCFILSCGSEYVQRFAYADVLGFSMFPSKKTTEPHESEPAYGINTTEEHSPVEVEVDEFEKRQIFRRKVLAVIVDIIIFLNNFGSLIVYSRIIGDAVPVVLKQFFKAHGVAISKWLWYVVPSIIFNVLMCARTISELKFVSLMGFLTILYVVVIVFVRFFMNFHSYYTTDEGHKDLRVAEGRISLFSTIAAFSNAFACQYNIPIMYGELRDRRVAVFKKTIYIASPIISFCYYFTALFGYIIFGATVSSKKAGGNIMNNFHDGDISANIGRILLFFHFLAVYPVVGFSARRGIHRLICMAFVRKKTYDANNKLIPAGDPSIASWPAIIIEATCMVWIGTLLAYFVPGLGVAIELIGTLFASPLIYVFPGLIGIFIYKVGKYPAKLSFLKTFRALSFVELVVGAIFLICGIIAFIMGQVND